MKLLLVFIALLIGCTKSNRPMLQLEMYSDTQTALYVVEQNGTIEFGGGTNALVGRTSWKGALTSIQLTKLQELLESVQTQSVQRKLGNRYVIEVQQGDSFHKYVVNLTDSFATELYYFLEESTLHRIQSHLDSLPKPSMDVIAERTIEGSKN